MASLKDIRKRINTVKSTQKITRAMKMVAGARLNRAQRRITELRPYAVKTQEVLAEVTYEGRQALAKAADEADAQQQLDTPDEVHPLLDVRPERRVLLVVLTRGGVAPLVSVSIIVIVSRCRELFALARRLCRLSRGLARRGDGLALRSALGSPRFTTFVTQG